MMSRLFRLQLAVLIITLVAASMSSAIAEAPMARTSAPGFYRIQLGDFEVTALSDGTKKLPVGTLFSVGPEQTAAGLARSHESSTYEMSFNAFLINTGAKLILIDAGCGTLFGPTTGRLVDNLRASGYRPEQVDEIYLTHMHLDHVGGLTRNGQRVFPNAIVRADAAEAAWWLNERNAAAAPPAAKDFFVAAQGSLKPYADVGRFKPFTGSVPLAAGVRSVEEYGHTPGHSGYLVESGSRRLLLWGDMIHVAELQFDDPTITFEFDSAPKAAEATREGKLRSLSTDGTLVGAAHISFPGLGYIRRTATAYAWVPLPYSSQPLADLKK